MRYPDPQPSRLPASSGSGGDEPRVVCGASRGRRRQARTHSAEAPAPLTLPAPRVCESPSVGDTAARRVCLAGKHQQRRELHWTTRRSASWLGGGTESGHAPNTPLHVIGGGALGLDTSGQSIPYISGWGEANDLGPLASRPKRYTRSPQRSKRVRLATARGTSSEARSRAHTGTQHARRERT
jgi:hypothetical protein